MGKLINRTLWWVVLLLLSGRVAAQEGEKKEQLPPPRPVPNLLLPPLPAPPELGRYDIWQYYAVDYTGRFRPRVVTFPFGSFYLHNLEPYPWTTTNSLLYMPYAMD